MNKEQIITAFDGLGKILLAIGNQEEWIGYELGVMNVNWQAPIRVQ